MKILKEWFVEAPWGHIAMVSWGSPLGYPILLVHGRQDSAATFRPLLELLPAHHHYVCMELPGHGKSDPFPTGVMLMRFQNVSAVDIVLRHLGWTEFYYLGHSLGTEQGLFYSAIYPNRIKKLILLDPAPALAKIQVRDFPQYFQTFHNDYYDHYHKYNKDTRVFSYKDAVSAVMRARKLSEAQAQLVLSRNLHRIGDDQYRLSWDRRLKTPAPLNLPDDYYFDLFSHNCPPTLVVSASGPRRDGNKGIDETYKLLKRLEVAVPSFTVLDVEGSHDVHLTHPERFVSELVAFLEKDFGGFTAKL